MVKLPSHSAAAAPMAVSPAGHAVVTVQHRQLRQAGPAPARPCRVRAPPQFSWCIFQPTWMHKARRLRHSRAAMARPGADDEAAAVADLDSWAPESTQMAPPARDVGAAPISGDAGATTTRRQRATAPREARARGGRVAAAPQSHWDQPITGTVVLDRHISGRSRGGSVGSHATPHGSGGAPASAQPPRRALERGPSPHGAAAADEAADGRPTWKPVAHGRRAGSQQQRRVGGPAAVHPPGVGLNKPYRGPGGSPSPVSSAAGTPRGTGRAGVPRLNLGGAAARSRDGAVSQTDRPQEARRGSSLRSVGGGIASGPASARVRVGGSRGSRASAAGSDARSRAPSARYYGGASRASRSSGTHVPGGVVLHSSARLYGDSKLLDRLANGSRERTDAEKRAALREVRERREAVILPEARPPEELTASQAAALRAQQKLVRNIKRSDVATAPTRDEILRLFRHCAPSEFGNLSRTAFVGGIRQRFSDVTEGEAQALFDVVDLDGSGDVDVSEFTQIFMPVDRTDIKPPPARRPWRLPQEPHDALPDALREEVERVHASRAHGAGDARRSRGPSTASSEGSAPPAAGGSLQAAASRPVGQRKKRGIKDVFPLKPVSYGDLPKEAQDEYRDRVHVQRALDKHGPSLAHGFVRRHEAGGAIHRRTRLGYDEAAVELRKAGVDLSAERLRQLYPPMAEGTAPSLTVSELWAQTRDYFNQLEAQHNEQSMVGKPVLEMHGVELGCRGYAATKTDHTPRQMDTLAAKPGAVAAGPEDTFVQWADKRVDVPIAVRSQKQHFRTGSRLNPVTWEESDA